VDRPARLHLLEELRTETGSIFKGVLNLTDEDYRWSCVGRSAWKTICPVVDVTVA
jgi:hypothetical protein